MNRPAPPVHTILQASTIANFGEQLRVWRRRRCLSQMEFAAAAEISTRHLSFIETGRANASREMVLRLTSRLEVPLRERNSLLVAAGYAPMYRESGLGDPALAAVKAAVELVLKSHEPFPALAIDRHWSMVAANRMVSHLLADVDESLLQAPVNVLRVTLHPLGLARRIINLAQWRAHLFERLTRQIAATADPVLTALLAELRALPAPASEREEHVEGGHRGIAVPMRFESRWGVLSFISTTTIFGSPVDVTLQEMALETFLPLDDMTMQAVLHRVRPNE